MLSQEQMSAIAGMIGTTADELAKAISDEQEQTIELPKGRFLTEENEATLLDNHGKKKYDEGVSKKAKENFDGKTKEEYDNALKTSILEEAKIEPNKKLEEANNSILALQETITEKENAYKELESNMNKQALESRILSKIPTNTVGLNNKTVLNEMRSNGYSVTDVDGVLSVSKDGATLKDNLQNPLNFETVANQFLTEKKWNEVKKEGRGKGDEGGQGSGVSIKSMEDFEGYCSKNSIDPFSEEAKAVLIEARKENNF